MSLNNNNNSNITANFEHKNNSNDSQLTEVEDDREYLSCSSLSSVRTDTKNKSNHPLRHEIDYDSISLNKEEDVDSLGRKRVSGSSTSTLKYNDTEMSKVTSKNPEKAPAHERITIVDLPFQRDDIYVNPNNNTSQDDIQNHPWIDFLQSNWVYCWVHQQCLDPRNRYGFQMAVGFLISTMFVVVDPISSVFPNAFWVGVSVVTVLDNTVGGFLTLSLQRLIGTIIGGGCSIVIITVTRAIFHPNWGWQAVVFFCSLMSVQVFFIAKLKIKPNMAYTGGIGLLTTIIISLSGYSDLIHDRLSYIAELGAWRTLNLIIGILIAMLVAVFVFPLKASKMMRKNIGKSIEDAADLYEKAIESYLSLSNQQHLPQESNIANILSQKLHPNTSTSNYLETTATTNSNAFNGGRRESTAFSIFSSSNKKKFSFTETIRRAFSTRPPESNNLDIQEQQAPENTDDNGNKASNQKSLKDISTGAYTILTKLQTESNRLKNVSTEYKIQSVFHFFEGGKQKCIKDLRRAKRYNQAIDAMKHIVWPLTSFRLLLPLVTKQPRIEEENEKIKTTQYFQDQQSRYVTEDILECFTDSINVMRQLAAILKKNDTPLSAFMDEWISMDRMVNSGSNFIQRELRQLMEHSHDNVKLLSHYGFLVRCSVIWEGLRTILDKLSPLNGTLSRASSMGALPICEIRHADE